MGAARRRSTQGDQTYGYNRRTKLGTFEWGGMLPDGSPGSLPENRPRALFNTRRVAGSIIPRPGQTTIVDDLAGGNTRYIDDFPITRAPLIVVGTGCPDFSPSVGFYIGSYDHEQSPRLQTNVYYATATGALNSAKFGDDLYIGHDKELRRYQPIDVPYGDSALSASGASQDIKLFTGPSTFTKITFMKEFDGKLFVCYDGRVVIWDGTTETIDLDGIGTPTGGGIFRDQLVIGYASSPNHIRIRSAGSAPGTWATVTPSGGTVKIQKTISYKNVFYISTNDDYLFKYDGTTLDPIVAATLGITAGSHTRGMAVFNGYLFVVYLTAAGLVKIARFDGTTWVPIHKSISGQFTHASFALPLVEYRGSLVLGGTDSLAGSTVWVSNGTDTSGNWTAYDMGASNGGDIFDLVTP